MFSYTMYTPSIRRPSLWSLLLVALLLAATGCDTVDSGTCDLGSSQGECGTTSSDKTAPTVSITSPVANASVSGAATLEASASDNEQVTKVEFYLDGQLAGTSTSSPWSYTWETLPSGDGNHTIQAKAYDAAGNQGVSQVVTVTAKNGFQLTISNTTFTPVSIQPSGQATRTVAPGGSTTFTYELNPGTITYNASTRGRHGSTVRWTNQSINSRARTSERVSLSVGDRLFFLRLKNSSDRSTSSLYVNYGASGEVEIKPYTLGGSWADVGYFQGRSQTKIRIYAKYRFPDLGPVYWEWTENVPSQPNYRVQFTLNNGSNAAKQADGGVMLQTEADASLPPLPPTDGLVHYGEAGN